MRQGNKKSRNQEEKLNFSVKKWRMLLEDENIFSVESLSVLKRLFDYGGMATSSQLATKYGNTKEFYQEKFCEMARNLGTYTNNKIIELDERQSKYIPVLYVGKFINCHKVGNPIWKLTDELYQALEQINLFYIPLYDTKKKEGKVQNEVERNYWWLNANPKIWSFSEIIVGEVQNYTLYNENGHKRRIFQNFLDAKKGDLIIGYESHPVKQVVALARVVENSDGENLYFEKLEGFTVSIDYTVLKNCPELERMEFFLNPNGSLFKLTEGEYEVIMDMVREMNPIVLPKKEIDFYTKEQFLEEVYLPEERAKRLMELLKYKKNIILQGAPGVGKTFTAKRLAYAMLGQKKEENIELVQFHQNYSYEDFVMGYKPKGENFELVRGVFYEFCQRAANHPDEDFFFLIDEMNRGNLSKIFGELLMLIEKDYRGTKVVLPYSQTSFSVPENVYIIGMMNTADRSLAMIDYALRRRFSFFEMEPAFLSEGFRKYQKSLESEKLNRLIEKIELLNLEIEKDYALGKGFCIGHSYFCNQDSYSDAWLCMVVEYDILPMLREYWFDEPERVKKWEEILLGVVDE